MAFPVTLFIHSFQPRNQRTVMPISRQTGCVLSPAIIILTTDFTCRYAVLIKVSEVCHSAAAALFNVTASIRPDGSRILKTIPARRVEKIKEESRKLFSSRAAGLLAAEYSAYQAIMRNDILYQPR